MNETTQYEETILNTIPAEHATQAEARLAGIFATRNLTPTQFQEHYTWTQQTLKHLTNHSLHTHQQLTRTHTETREPEYSPHRTYTHQRILQTILQQNRNTPTERKAILIGGLPGAGKTTIINAHLPNWLNISADHIKHHLLTENLIPHIPGFLPMEATAIAYQEASTLAEQLAQQALTHGYNVTYDIMMGSMPAVTRRLNMLQEHGYQTEAWFIRTHPQTALQRTQQRQHNGLQQAILTGTPGSIIIPPEVIHALTNPPGTTPTTVNEQIFHHLTQQGHFQHARLINT